jgi:hypothetical protein
MTKTVKFNGEELNVKMAKYENGQNAIQLIDQDGMPYMTASVGHAINISDDDVIIKDYSENEGIMASLIEAGIIDKPYCEVPSGFVTLYVARLRK